MLIQILTSNLKGFVRRDAGGITMMNIYFLVAVAMLAGIGIDVSNLMTARTHLQTVADTAAHAALVEREWNDADTSRDKAIALVKANMPPDYYGDVVEIEKISFGDWDRATRTFTVDDNDRGAVLVETTRSSENGNAVGTFLLKLVGLWNWDVTTVSVFETFRPTCLIEGFVAEGVVDIQSNNSYFNGFCIHSNSHVEINQNNFFESGTIVSMPDSGDLVVPNDGLDDEKNEGLAKALREGRWFIKILDRLGKIIEGVQDEDSRYARAYIDYDEDVLTLSGNSADPADFEKGRIYKLSCNKFSFGSGIYEEFIFIADCPLTFKNGAEFRDAVIITTSTSNKSMSAPNNLVLGKPDDCGAGGGAQLITYGDFDVAASLEMHGSQIIAAGNVEFAANADGIRGASIVAGGRIDGTSNMNFSFCGKGMDDSFAAEYFRLAG
ncbi:TadE/TadG family type IV pilus assembly protein [Roseibium sp.]|uniref:TadE/TadG family type IV pilus assembly protein n=1 Tax=Roseibium sp. TaxID=1936156 RepID=UPI003D14F0D8